MPKNSQKKFVAKSTRLTPAAILTTSTRAFSSPSTAPSARKTVATASAFCAVFAVFPVFGCSTDQILGTDRREEKKTEADSGLQAPVPDSMARSNPAQKGTQPEADQDSSANRVIENPVVEVNAQDPSSFTSTFSVDVDTSSYSFMRSQLQGGSLPKPQDVRIEEYLNYFDYGYPAITLKDPSEQAAGVQEAPISTVMDAMPAPWNPEAHLVRIGIRAADAPADAYQQENGRNFVFLIDTSGSMQWNGGISLVKESMKLLVEQLKPQDRVAIVTYAGQSAVKLATTEGSDQIRIAQAIDSLDAGGSTNGAAGLQTAYELAMSAFIAGGVNRVFLATDGDFNVGPTSSEALLGLIEEKAKAGVFLTVLGVGKGNYNDALLEEISNRGNGYATYIDTIEEGRRVLIDKLNSGVVTVAKDVKVQLAFDPAQVKSWRLIGYENRVLENEDFENEAKDAGDMGSGHETTALYELSFHPSSDGAGAPVDRLATDFMTLKFRYKNPFDQVSQELTISPSNSRRHPESLSFAAGVACFGLVLKQSKHKGNCTLPMARELVFSQVKSPSVTETAHLLREQLVQLIQRATEMQTLMP